MFNFLKLKSTWSFNFEVMLNFLKLKSTWSFNFEVMFKFLNLKCAWSFHFEVMFNFLTLRTSKTWMFRLFFLLLSILFHPETASQTPTQANKYKLRATQGFFLTINSIGAKFFICLLRKQHVMYSSTLIHVLHSQVSSGKSLDFASNGFPFIFKNLI